MTLRLREDVFIARADGFVVFLDLGRDRYFALNTKLSVQLGSVIEAKGEGADQDLICRLRQAGALAEGEGDGRAFSPVATRPVLHQAQTGGANVATTITAAFCRWRAERELSRKHLSNIVDRRRHARLLGCEQAQTADLVDAASRFVAVRALRGARDACLKEALALLYFLGSRGRSADWVFAVKGAPFAAHCWVQLGDTVLNDSVENVAGYTPIMVV